MSVAGSAGDACPSHEATRAVVTCTRLRAPRLSAFSRISAAVRALASTKVQRTAPRLRASSPSAPEPAYRSSTTAPWRSIRFSTMLKRAPRTFSAVGRVASPLGVAMRRPPNSPPIIRSMGSSAWPPQADASPWPLRRGGCYHRPVSRPTTPPPSARGMSRYRQLSRTAYYGVVAAFPLLAAYEALLYLSPHPAAYQVRNAADVWLRTLLASLGANPRQATLAMMLILA